MRQTAAVARLAVRELWISFRLLAVVTAFVAPGALVALLPAPLTAIADRLALGLGAATAFVGGVAAWSLARERVAGRAGWLVTRSVPRPTLLAGWYVALAALGLLGLVVAGTLGWLAASAVALRLDAVRFAGVIGGAWASLLAAVALGLLAGSVLRPAAAALATVTVAVGVGFASWTQAGLGQWLPGGAFVELAALSEATPAPDAPGRAAGVSLIVAGALLVFARVALDRAEL